MIDRFKHFLKRCEELHGNKFNYDKFIYINAKTSGVIICPIHGEFYQTPDKHLSKNSKGCQQCWNDIKNELFKQRKNYVKREIVPKDDFLKLCVKKFGDKYEYDLSNYNGYTKDDIKIICPIHGEILIKPKNHLITQTGCKKCGRLMANKSMTHTLEFFLNQCKLVHGNKYTYPYLEHEYQNKKSIITIICPEHGFFLKKSQNHLKGQACFQCKIDELIRDNILTGGYSDNLFSAKPTLKEIPAYLYYFKINDGELYKIGITKINVFERIKSLKFKSLKKIKNIEVIGIKQLPLYQAYKQEQKILDDNKNFRKITKWSTELFSIDIWPKINKYFNYES